MESKVTKTVISRKATDNWRTPREIFDRLNAALVGARLPQFDLDAFASARNALCARFYSDQDPAPVGDWGASAWFANPCYSRAAFASHALAIVANKDYLGVALVRSDLGTGAGRMLAGAAQAVVHWPERIAFLDNHGPLKGSNFSNVLLFFGGKADVKDWVEELCARPLVLRGRAAETVQLKAFLCP